MENGKILKLHLGCGERYLNGYINIDYPSNHHSIMKVKADVYQDITTLHYEDNSVDEIRLHHVFEHFNRVEAIGSLIKWHKWLKLGGILRIETPDFENGAKIILSKDIPLEIRLKQIRHLEGDQVEDWAYHITQWFRERFEYTLTNLGFNIESIKQSFWDKSPHLANIETIAKKNIHLSNPNLLRNAGSLLKDFTVSPVEEATYNSWLTQLENFLTNKKDTKNNIFNSSVDNSIPLNQIHNFNQLNRDKWITNKANNIKAGSKVIDIGAGTCPYKSLFNHCDYYAHDFKKYSGEKLGGTKDYADIDIVSDIESIPVNDESFDVVICTEVLEHVPEPIKALKEMSRILKKGGTILITAPLGSGLHQLPYHYYGGYTPEWYKKFLIESGIEIQEITPNGGFFKHLAQECARVAWKFGLHKNYHNNPDEVYNMFYNELPRLLYSLDDNCFIEDFTVGYFVEGIKR